MFNFSICIFVGDLTVFCRVFLFFLEMSLPSQPLWAYWGRIQSRLQNKLSGPLLGSTRTRNLWSVCSKVCFFQQGRCFGSAASLRLGKRNKVNNTQQKGFKLSLSASEFWILDSVVVFKEFDLALDFSFLLFSSSSLVCAVLSSECNAERGLRYASTRHSDVYVPPQAALISTIL